MKRVLIVLAVFFIFSCNTKSENRIIYKKENQIVMNNVLYNITFNFKSVGYQIFVNEILVDQRLSGGMTNSLSINQYFNDNNEQKIRIKLFKLDGSNLSEKDLLVQECVVFKDVKNSNTPSIFHKFNFKANKLEFPFFEIEDKIIINEKLNTEGLEILENAIDLSSVDENILQESLIKKLQELKEDLNNGNYNLFMNELNFRNNNYFKSNYYTENDINKYKSNASKMLMEYKNNMLPIENYKLVFSGNNKLVTLERIDKKYLGNGVLLAENNIDKVLYLNYITFFIPKNEQNLKIFDFNARATSL